LRAWVHGNDQYSRSSKQRIGVITKKKKKKGEERGKKGPLCGSGKGRRLRREIIKNGKAKKGTGRRANGPRGTDALKKAGRTGRVEKGD